MKKAMENAQEYGKSWMFQVAVEDGGLEEWRGLNYPAFCQALSNANAPVRFEAEDWDANLYNAAVDAAWDELQRLLKEAAE